MELHDLVNANVAIAIHDGIYLQDYSVKSVSLNGHSKDDRIADHVVEELKAYERGYLAKFIGVGFPFGLGEQSPALSSRLWLELDIVPILIPVNLEYTREFEVRVSTYWNNKSVDEQADSMARKCIMYVFKNK